jgi:hypothetical protein
MFGISSCDNAKYLAEHSELIGSDVPAHFELVMKFSPASCSGTHVSLLCQYNPGGYVPRWVNNRLICQYSTYVDKMVAFIHNN